jgi:hypothetical protein
MKNVVDVKALLIGLGLSNQQIETIIQMAEETDEQS